MHVSGHILNRKGKHQVLLNIIFEREGLGGSLVLTHRLGKLLNILM